MKLLDVGFHKATIDALLKQPLIRDNVKNMESDFNVIFAKMLEKELDEDVSEEDMIKIKTDLFAAFAHGMQAGTRTDSRFRLGFKLPAEFDPAKKLIKPSGLILPGK